MRFSFIGFNNYERLRFSGAYMFERELCFRHMLSISSLRQCVPPINIFQLKHCLHPHFFGIETGKLNAYPLVLLPQISLFLSWYVIFMHISLFSLSCTDKVSISWQFPCRIAGDRHANDQAGIAPVRWPILERDSLYIDYAGCIVLALCVQYIQPT